MQNRLFAAFEQLLEARIEAAVAAGIFDVGVETLTAESFRVAATGADTRCYFAVAKNPPKDTPKTDVGDTVYCGPALFVDGDSNKPYIPYGLSAGTASGDKVSLSVSSKGTEAGATAVPADRTLVRPDGAKAPSGAGGLSVPEPPPAAANVFTAVEGVDVPDAPAGATMGALDGGVTIEKLGEIKRFGTGSEARSAPSGQKLIAFALGEAAGDGASDGPGVLKLTVSVNGGAGQAIQSFNLMMGFDEKLTLAEPGLWP